MPDGMEWEKIPAALLTDCAQLVKANSIEGNKKDNLTIIYTPGSNLKVCARDLSSLAVSINRKALENW
jgi:hypothetical protein